MKTLTTVFILEYKWIHCSVHYTALWDLLGHQKSFSKETCKLCYHKLEVISLFQLINLYKYIVSRLEMSYTFGVLSKLLDE